MGCKALDVVYFEQGGPNESRVLRLLGSSAETTIKGDYLTVNGYTVLYFYIIFVITFKIKYELFS